MIAVLIERGCAYRADDGSVYFRIKSFPRYGALAHFNLDELQSTGRVRSDEYEKEEASDFALWKAWDPRGWRRLVGESLGARSPWLAYRM